MRGNVAAEGTGVVHTERGVLADSGVKADTDHAHAGEFLAGDAGRTRIANRDLSRSFLVTEELHVADVGTNLHCHAAGRERQSTAHTDVGEAKVLIVNLSLDTVVASTLREVVTFNHDKPIYGST